MPGISALLPPHLVDSLARRAAPRPPSVQRFPAGLLLADVSGFTALTEKLQENGRAGAEEIAAIVNAVFRPALRAIRQRGGSVVSFGGDAVFAIFPGVDGGRRARCAAEAIEATATRAPAVAGLGIRIALTVHFGTVSGIHLGTPDRRRYLVTGRAVRRLATMEGTAVPGRVEVSSAARRAASVPLLRPRRPAAAPPSRLAPYVPRELRAWSRGDFRDVTVAFLETRGDGGLELQPFYLALDGVLAKHGGVLLKTDLSPSGTRWVVVFGLPQVHEDDTLRAARALLDLREALPRRPRWRAGLHAGVVACLIVGDAHRNGVDVMGDVVNTAARAMAEARWGEIWMTAACGSRIATGSVMLTPRGARHVKGKELPLQLHALRGLGAGHVPPPSGPPLVGRETEMSLLVEALDTAAKGRGTAVALFGPPGAGKTRLAAEVARRAAARGFALHLLPATGLERGTHGPVATLLQGLLQLRGKDPDRRLQRAVRALPAPDVAIDHVRVAMGLPMRPGSPLRHGSPRTIRRAVALAVARLVSAAATRAPVLLVAEDLHAAGSLQREALAAIARAAGGSRLLLLLLARDGYAPPPDARQIVLADLPEPAVAELVAETVGRGSTGLVKTVRDRAGGNPLHVIALLEHLEAMGVLSRRRGLTSLRGTRWRSVPAGFERLAAARLHALPPSVRRCVRLGAVLGQSFSGRLARRVDPVSARSLRLAVEAGILVSEGSGPHDSYTFRSPMLREAAYEAILMADRRRLHRAAALALTRGRRAHAAALATHWEMAGEPQRACPLYLEAFRAARTVHEIEDAERYLRAYLALAPGRHPGHERELATLAANQGRTEEALELAERALEAARQAAAPLQIVHSLSTIAQLQYRLGALDASRACLTEAVSICRQAGLPNDAATVGVNLASLTEDAQESLRLYEEALATHRRHGDFGGVAHAMSNMARVLDGLGRHEEARRIYAETLALHRKLGNARSEALVLGNMGVALTAFGDLGGACEALRAAAALARRIGERPIEASALGNLGPVLLGLGRHAEAAAVLHEALEIHREVGDRGFEATVLQALGEVAIERRQLDEARRYLTEAVSFRHRGLDASLDVTALCALARVERLAGDLDAAVRHLGEADALAAGLSHGAKALCLVEHGHLALCRGDTARPDLTAAVEIRTRHTVHADVHAAIARLQRAVDHRERGGALEGGEVTSVQSIG